MDLEARNLVFFDKTQKRLVYMGHKSSENNWDKHWSSGHKTLKKNNFIAAQTKKYLAQGSSVLEGGCGVGDKVYTLQSEGYQAVGIDWAKETIKNINQNHPELKCEVGDVRALRFTDNTFDGYWSLGVIEHFYTGFEVPMKEAFRVIKPGGYLFLTIPIFNQLRQVKAQFGYYPFWDIDAQSKAEDRFYQFVLSDSQVISYAQELGFKLVKKEMMDGIKGLKDEVVLLNKPLGWAYNSNTLLARGVRFVTNKLFKRYTGHICFFVFEKMK